MPLLIIGTASRTGRFYCLEAICKIHLLLRLCEVLLMCLLILILWTFPIEVASLFIYYTAASDIPLHNCNNFLNHKKHVQFLHRFIRGNLKNHEIPVSEFRVF